MYKAVFPMPKNNGSLGSENNQKPCFVGAKGSASHPRVGVSRSNLINGIEIGSKEDLFKPKNILQASQTVTSIATYYMDYVSLFIPSEPKQRLIDGMELLTKERKPLGYQDQKNKEDLIERSLRHTKKLIKGYVGCNTFDLFATFTFKADRDDVDLSKRKMATWIKNHHKRKGKFKYLIVPEFHKDKVSIHFHALLKGFNEKLTEAINPKTGKPLKQKGRQIYTIPSYKYGFTNVVKIEQDAESRKIISSYVTKYITKDMPVFFGKNRFWSSKGLETPKIEYNPNPLLLQQAAVWSKNFQNGTVMIFNYEDLPAILWGHRVSLHDPTGRATISFPQRMPDSESLR